MDQKSLFCIAVGYFALSKKSSVESKDDDLEGDICILSVQQPSCSSDRHLPNSLKYKNGEEVQPKRLARFMSVPLNRSDQEIDSIRKLKLYLLGLAII